MRVVHFWVSRIDLILQLKISFHHVPKYLALGSGLRGTE